MPLNEVNSAADAVATARIRGPRQDTGLRGCVDSDNTQWPRLLPRRLNKRQRKRQNKRALVTL